MTTTIDIQSQYITDEEFSGGQPMLRRLFDVHYSCPLCGRDHNAETYIAHTTDSLDDLHAHAKACMRQRDVVLPLLGQHMVYLHRERDDYQRLREEADAGDVKGPLRIHSVTMTAESEISCEQCAHRFDTIGAFQEHMGVNPATGARYREIACRA